MLKRVQYAAREVFFFMLLINFPFFLSRVIFTNGAPFIFADLTFYIDRLVGKLIVKDSPTLVPAVSTNAIKSNLLGFH